MVRICPWLLIGRYTETCDRVLLRTYQIGAVLQLAEPIKQPGIAQLSLSVEDGLSIDPALLRRGVDFVLAQHAAGQRVLVACGAGISRSTSFAIAALKEAEVLPLREATLIVRRAHPTGMPHLALWEALCAYYGEPVAYLDLLRMAEEA